MMAGLPYVCEVPFIIKVFQAYLAIYVGLSGMLVIIFDGLGRDKRVVATK